MVSWFFFVVIHDKKITIHNKNLANHYFIFMLGMALIRVPPGNMLNHTYRSVTDVP